MALINNSYDGEIEELNELMDYTVGLIKSKLTLPERIEAVIEKYGEGKDLKPESVET